MNKLLVVVLVGLVLVTNIGMSGAQAPVTCQAGYFARSVEGKVVEFVLVNADRLTSEEDCVALAQYQVLFDGQLLFVHTGMPNYVVASPEFLLVESAADGYIYGFDAGRIIIHAADVPQWSPINFDGELALVGFNGPRPVVLSTDGTLKELPEPKVGLDSSFGLLENGLFGDVRSPKHLEVVADLEKNTGAGLEPVFIFQANDGGYYIEYHLVDSSSPPIFFVIAANGEWVIENVGEIVISLFSRTALVIYNYQLDEIRVNFWTKGVQYIFVHDSAMISEVVSESERVVEVLVAYPDHAELLSLDPTE